MKIFERFSTGVMEKRFEYGNIERIFAVLKDPKKLVKKKGKTLNNLKIDMTLEEARLVFTKSKQLSTSGELSSYKYMNLLEFIEMIIRLAIENDKDEAKLNEVKLATFIDYLYQKMCLVQGLE